MKNNRTQNEVKEFVQIIQTWVRDFHKKTNNTKWDIWEDLMCVEREIKSRAVKRILDEVISIVHENAVNNSKINKNKKDVFQSQVKDILDAEFLDV